MCNSDSPYIFCSCFFERAGCLFERGSGGFDVINEDNGFSSQVHVFLGRENIVYVFMAKCGAKKCLRGVGGMANKYVRIKSQAEMIRYDACDKLGLVESSYAFFARMQGNGYDKSFCGDFDAIMLHVRDDDI